MGDATVIVVLWLADPPGPAHVTVYVVLEVNAGVVNEPVVPVPPPPDDVHEVLLVDVQLILAVAPFVIVDEDAVRVTVGIGTVGIGAAPPKDEVPVSVVTVPPPPHEVRPDSEKTIDKIILVRAFDPTV